MLHLLVFVWLIASFVTPIQKQIARKWELSGVQISKNFISAEELKSKNATITMQLFEDGRCIIKANNPKAIPKQNKWILEKDDKTTFLVIEAENDFGGKVKTKFKIEEISTKKLVLSLGEKQDKEIYYYKAVR
jgi:hypothetical protein